MAQKFKLALSIILYENNPRLRNRASPERGCRVIGSCKLDQTSSEWNERQHNPDHSTAGQPCKP